MAGYYSTGYITGLNPAVETAGCEYTKMDYVKRKLDSLRTIATIQRGQLCTSGTHIFTQRDLEIAVELFQAHSLALNNVT